MPRATHWSTCTAQKESGNFCDAPTIPEAPFPVCVRHAAQLYTFLSERIKESAHGSATSLDALIELTATGHQRTRQPSSWNDGVVYYVQVGELVKIGNAVNLRRRLTVYPPGRRLLATEPGGEMRERKRHHQFRASRVEREWFRPTDDLVAHIVKLRSAMRSRRPAA